MNQLTLTLMKVAFLAVLWLFVIAAVGVIRADLWGSKAAAKAMRPRKAAQPARQPKAAAPRTKRAEPTKLVITQGARAGTTLDLAGSEIVMGRGNDVTLPLGDDYSSGGTPGSSHRTVSGSWRISVPPTAPFWGVPR